MANNTITVFEHSKLHIGEQEFKEHHFEALVKFNDAHGSKYFTPGYRKITFRSYVGVIQVGNKVIEVLPKADNLPESDERTISKWQQALLYMLRKAGYIKLNETEKASQQALKHNLLDIYLFTFLKEVEQLLHVGLVKRYRKVQQNGTTLKGRLLIEKQARLNYIHKERFFVEHTVYNRNNLLNSILKRSLEIIQLTSTNYSIKQHAAKQLLFFEGIDSWNGAIKQFDKIILDRKTKSYSYAIELAKMIILNYNPNMSAGSTPVLALMFDMSRLFEKFVYRMLKHEEKSFKTEKLSVRQQSPKAFWKDRTIRPDLVIDLEKKNEEGNILPYRFIVDTKWKVINSDNPSDDDLKQMYTYNLQFGSQLSILFYPSTGQKNLGSNSFAKTKVLPGHEHGCEVYFSELFNPDNSLNNTFANQFLCYLLTSKHLNSQP